MGISADVNNFSTKKLILLQTNWPQKLKELVVELIFLCNESLTNCVNNKMPKHDWLLTVFNWLFHVQTVQFDLSNHKHL